MRLESQDHTYFACLLPVLHQDNYGNVQRKMLQGEDTKGKSTEPLEGGS